MSNYYRIAYQVDITHYRNFTTVTMPLKSKALYYTPPYKRFKVVNSHVFCVFPNIYVHLKAITGHGVIPAAGSDGLMMGTRFTTENASLSRAARLIT